MRLLILLTTPTMCASNTRDHQLWLGLVAFVIGTVLLLERFDLVPTETWDYLWPSILVLTGLKLMLICKDSPKECCGSSCEMESSSCDCGDGACGGCEMPMVMPKKAAKKKTGKK